jgi:hypothetical protein
VGEISSSGIVASYQASTSVAMVARPMAERRRIREFLDPANAEQCLWKRLQRHFHLS